jgi:hypothetical protein
MCPAMLFVTYHRQQLGEQATGYQPWLEAIRLGMGAPDLKAFLVQAYVAASSELFFLYAILRTRGAEVYVFSHVRLVCATILTGAIGAACFHGVVWAASGRPLIVYVLISIASVWGVGGLAGMLQATVVDAFDAMGSDPIVKDLARKPEVGKFGDFNSWIIRRWGQFILLTFLLLPGLVVNAPAPPLVRGILLCLVVLPAAYTIASTTLWYLDDV